MKFVIVVLVVLLGVWLWRKNRADDRNDAAEKPPRTQTTNPGTPQIMVSCAVCGVHLPQGEAVKGKSNHYCSLAHRQQQEN
jgi:uncharacterized protein